MVKILSRALLVVCLAAVVPPVVAGAAPRKPLPVLEAAPLQPSLSCGRPGQVDDPSDSSASFTGLPAANDVAVGVPGAARGSRSRAGMVEVRYSCAAVQGIQELQLPSPHTGDRFGTAVTTAHLNDDLYDDLVVGVPGLDVGGAKDAGGVALFLGSAQGLVYSRTLTQSSPDVPGKAQAGAHFGATVGFSAERWYDDEPDGLLAVGAPDKDVAGAKDAGAVVLMRTLVSSEPAVREELTLATPRVPGSPGKGDHLGAALSIESEDEFWAIGLPGRRVHGHGRAGAVLASARGDASGFALLTQDTPGFAGTAETGDAFGTSLGGGWIGVPGEDTSEGTDAGVLQSLFDGSIVRLGTDGFPGGARAGDRLGASLSVWVPPGFDRHQYRVLAGMPGADVAGVKDAGAVLVFTYLPSGSPRISFPSTTTMPDPVRGARFGAAATRASSQVLVGAPGADAGRGRVAVYGSPSTNRPLELQGGWAQVGDAASGNGFGSSFGGIPNLF